MAVYSPNILGGLLSVLHLKVIIVAALSSNLVKSYDSVPNLEEKFSSPYVGVTTNRKSLIPVL